MGKYIDFVIEYNSDPEILGTSILRNIMCNRLKAKKPCIIFLTGDSGEGKSFTGLKLIDIVNKEYGLDTMNVLNDSIVYQPLEYVKKLDACLFYKKNQRMDLKDLHVLMIDEAREVVRAKLWYTFINQAIADCNAMSRTIKPLVLIIISQFIKDIDSSVRYTINFYGNCARPLYRRTRFSFERVWKNDYDIERPRLCKRPVVGYLNNENSWSICRPHFEVSLPKQEIIDKYEVQNTEAKTKILRKKIEKTMKLLEREMGNQFDTVNALVTYYLENTEQLTIIRDKTHKKFMLSKQFDILHPNITGIEKAEFKRLLLEQLAQKGLAAAEKEIEGGSIG